MRPHPVSKKRQQQDQRRKIRKYRRINANWQRSYDEMAARMNKSWDKMLWGLMAAVPKKEVI